MLDIKGFDALLEVSMAFHNARDSHHQRKVKGQPFSRSAATAHDEPAQAPSLACLCLHVCDPQQHLHSKRTAAHVHTCLRDRVALMSNGLADASFFPTAKELSTGLRWVKDHPVLAAAAATAVSVITFLNAAETLAHSRSSTALLDDALDDDSSNSASLDAVFQKHDIVARRRKVETESHVRAAAKRTAAALSSSSGRTSPPSDAKLAAAVSWCDEHGGSLTQVFEDMHVTDNDDITVDQCDSKRSAGSASTVSSDVVPMTRRPPTGAIKKSSTQQSIDLSALEHDLLGSSSHDDDDPRDAASRSPAELFERQTESPQWGWYVAITPPQDPLHSALPRAALPPPHRGSNASSRAPLHTGVAPSMRRSTSGRITSTSSS